VAPLQVLPPHWPQAPLQLPGLGAIEVVEVVATVVVAVVGAAVVVAAVVDAAVVVGDEAVQSQGPSALHGHIPAERYSQAAAHLASVAERTLPARARQVLMVPP